MLTRGLRGLLGGLLGRLFLFYFLRRVWGDEDGVGSFTIFIQLCGSLPSLSSSDSEIHFRITISLGSYSYQGDWTRSVFFARTIHTHIQILSQLPTSDFSTNRGPLPKHSYNRGTSVWEAGPG